MARNFTLADVFNAGADFASTVATIQDRQLKEKAETDLLYMQAQVDSAASAFMQDLAQRNDYSNWQKDLDSFISQQGNKLQKESANAYTAKRAQEMMLRYRGELEQKVQLEALAKHKENILVTNQHTLDLIRKNFSGQERINKAGVVHDRQYANGSIDETRYHAESVNGANTAQFEYYVSLGSDLFEEALNSGKGISLIEAAIDNDAKQFELKVLTPDSANVESLENGTAKYIDISSSINTQENKRQAKKTVNNAYNSYVNDIQRSNENQLSMQYTKLMDPTISDTERFTLASQGYTMLEKMKGEQLDPNVRDEYAKKFSLVKENNGLLSGSKKSVESFVKEMSKTDINGLIDMYCLAAQRGSQSSFGGAESLYTARSALQSVLSDSGVNPGEISSALHVLTDKYCNTILNQPHLKGLKNRLEAFEKDVYKNRDKWPKDAVAHATGWMLDQLAQSNQSEIDSDDLEKEFDNMLATTYSKSIDKMLVVKNIENEKEVGKVAAGLESIDVVYTDVFGNPRWAGNTKDVINSETGVAIQFGKIVSRATGKTDLRQDWKQTDDGTDITNIPVFKDSEGNSYTVEPVYKNNNKEKGVTGYRVVDQNGKEYKGADQEALKKEDNAKRKELDKKKKEYRENFVKQSEEKRNQKRTERLNTVADMKKAPSVDDFIKKGVLDNSNKKDFEKTLEILKNDWNKLSKEERLQRIYEIENATGKEYFN